MKLEARYALTSRFLTSRFELNPLVITQVERKVKRLVKVKVDHVLVSVFRYKYLMKTR
jgi:hypothetical protein